MKKILFILLAISFSSYSQNCDTTARRYVDTYITTNGTRAITGARLNQALNKILDAVDCVDAGGGSAKAGNGLSMSNDTVVLGGTLNRQTTIEDNGNGLLLNMSDGFLPTSFLKTVGKLVLASKDSSDTGFPIVITGHNKGNNKGILVSGVNYGAGATAYGTGWTGQGDGGIINHGIATNQIGVSFQAESINGDGFVVAGSTQSSDDTKSAVSLAGNNSGTGSDITLTAINSKLKIEGLQSNSSDTVLVTNGEFIYTKVMSGGGSYIPLSGTEVGSPVTGDIEFGGNFAIKRPNNAGTDYNKVEINKDAVTILAITDDPIHTENSIVISTIDDSGISVTDGLTNPRGLRGAYDYTANIQDLDYPQKRYVDDKAGRIVELGTITYTDINSAPLAQDISIPLTTNNFPDSSYTVGLFYKINEPFDGSDNFNILDAGHNVLYELSESPVPTNYIGEYSASLIVRGLNSSSNEQYKDASFVAELALRFNVINSQDLTTGSVTIYAIVKPFPF